MKNYMLHLKKKNPSLVKQKLGLFLQNNARPNSARRTMAKIEKGGV